MVVVKLLSPLLPQLSICCVCQHIQLEDLPHLEFLIENLKEFLKRYFLLTANTTGRPLTSTREKLLVSLNYKTGDNLIYF